MALLKFDYNGNLVSQSTKTRSQAKAIRSTYRWRVLAKAQIEASPQCFYCGHLGSSDNPLTADHKLSVIDYPSLAYEPSNLVTACRQCNSKKGAR